MPTTPSGNDVVVTESAGLTVMERSFCTVQDPLSVTHIVKFDVPTPVGVPVIAPFDPFNVKPAGKLPTTVAHVYGVVPPAATKVAE